MGAQKMEHYTFKVVLKIRTCLPAEAREPAQKK